MRTLLRGLLFTLFSVLFMAGTMIVAQEATPEVMPEDEAAVAAVIETYIAAVETEDLEALDAIFTGDEEQTYYGTDGTEPLTGWTAAREGFAMQNAALDSLDITVTGQTVHIFADGSGAYVTGLWTFDMTMGEEAIQAPLRATFVLEKRDGEWKILHFHKSVGQ